MDQEILTKIEAVVDAPTCYTESERKPREVRLQELTDWYNKYNDVNVCYNLYGMDRVETTNLDQWLDRGIFLKQRHDVNATYYPEGSAFPYDYTLFMRDKQSFEMLMRSIHGNTNAFCRSYGIFENGKLYSFSEDGGKKEITADIFLKDFSGKNVVFKSTFGCSGTGVMVAMVQDNKIIYDSKTFTIKEFLDSLYNPRSNWLIQAFITQHPTMNKFNDTSVNTMRIVTFNTGKRVVITTAALRFGKHGKLVDNSVMGGLFTGVNDDGTVRNDMFSFTEKKRYENPNAGLKIPFWNEAKELVISTHERIPELFTIGWDVAITPEGPMIVEGNDGWGPNLSQTSVGHGLRIIWNELIKERSEF